MHIYEPAVPGPAFQQSEMPPLPPHPHPDPHPPAFAARGSGRGLAAICIHIAHDTAICMRMTQLFACARSTAQFCLHVTAHFCLSMPILKALQRHFTQTFHAPSSGALQQEPPAAHCPALSAGRRGPQQPPVRSHGRQRRSQVTARSQGGRFSRPATPGRRSIDILQRHL